MADEQNGQTIRCVACEGDMFPFEVQLIELHTTTAWVCVDPLACSRRIFWRGGNIPDLRLFAVLPGGRDDE